MAYILDTDHITLIEENSPPLLSRLEARLSAHPGEEVFFTVVSFQEHTRGWLAYLNKVRKNEQILLGYDRLLGVLRRYGQANVLPFDGPALDRYHELVRLKVRIGTLDLRIAAIALTRNAKLLSRNLRDFRKVPDLEVEDWTQ